MGAASLADRRGKASEGRPGNWRSGRLRLLGLAVFGVFCAMIDMAGVWRAGHPHVSDAYRRLYLVPGGIVNGATRTGAPPRWP
ncbi:hypothetical protein HLH33_10715 [Gluconacetobacter diazotrophicus]|uniref:Uncharacterized protein n=1 Tax=Gluconacetobacter diazotrophicus TaxID=33996 RepID=A0A7W4NFH8_GLUDI|nr:hypothetical protein [Gluconacetobacter diazotrophicus]